MLLVGGVPGSAMAGSRQLFERVEELPDFAEEAALPSVTLPPAMQVQAAFSTRWPALVTVFLLRPA